MTPNQPSPAIDTTVAHPARRYDYWLGGKDNFAADRESADAIEKIYPHIRTAAVENRRFLHRIVQHLVSTAGIRQFLDIGTGLPTADNTHQIAQRIDPTCRIVYADNDPLVLAHARALLTSDPRGATGYLQADLRQPQQILADPVLRDTLNLNEPVALLLIAVLHFLPETEQATRSITTLMDALPAGSYLAISHATADLLPAATATALATQAFPGKADFTSRSHKQIAGFFDGLDLIEPGICVINRWHNPDPDPAPPEHVAVYGALARKRR